MNAGFDPRKADADTDGPPTQLNDATIPTWRADSDGDGLSDAEEINGYNLTLTGQIIHVTSDPNQRDSDTDGISDGAERRLNGIDPVRYPFNPQVFNDSPARLYTTFSDTDRVLAAGASATVTTTVFNGTAVENALVASGRFTSTLPGQLGGATQSSNFTLLPAASKEIVLNGTAAAANGTFNINTGVAADLVAIGSSNRAPSTTCSRCACSCHHRQRPTNVPALTQVLLSNPATR